MLFIDNVSAIASAYNLTPKSTASPYVHSVMTGVCVICPVAYSEQVWRYVSDTATSFQCAVVLHDSIKSILSGDIVVGSCKTGIR
jgi:hypothetical protein